MRRSGSAVIRSAVVSVVWTIVAAGFAGEAEAVTVWGATVALNASTCGGEVAVSHARGPLGVASVDVDRTASQLVCGGQFGYAGDLPYAYTQGRADLPTGTVGVYAYVSGLGTLLTSGGSIVPVETANTTFSASVEDVLSFVVPAHTPLSIVLTAKIDGSYTQEVGSVSFSMGGSVTCTSASCFGSLSGDWSATTVFPDGTGTTVFLTRTIEVADNASDITFDYQFAMDLHGNAKPHVSVFGEPNVPSGEVDFAHTAGLSIDAGGASWTSASGLLLTAVPEPASAALVGVSCLGLALRPRSRR